MTADKLELLRLAAASDRGRYLSEAERRTVSGVIERLEAHNPAAASDSSLSDQLQGKWLLVYATDDPTRSSPFFWAFRQLTDGVMVSSLTWVRWT
jgi:hypothetical protein